MAQATETTSKRRGKGKEPPIARGDLLKAYRDMLLIRRFEEKAGQLYGMGLIGGFCHLYIGQEAVVVGVQMCLKPGDEVITSYRDHGHMLATGMEARGVMAELTGRIGGYSKGKGGSMHMFSREKGFYESLNLAALFKLPCIYVIENNKYGMGTSVERASASRDLSQNGAAWGIPGEQVNGMDVVAVREAAERAAAYCRANKGPYLLEMKTYRYRGHSMSDPAKYRTREEVQKMRETSDCIETARKLLVEQFAATEAELKVIDDEVKAIVQDAADFAQQSPEPPESELWTDVLVETK
jgi:pyruvate dehydrogenase E1 component alpha subunit